MDENMKENKAENMPDFRASGTNGSITLAEVRKGTAVYQYDPYNVTNKGVEVVQTALHMYGFNLSQDGLFGSTTKAVVKGFQVAANVSTKNGIVNAETLAKLEAWCGTLYETPERHPSIKQIRYGLVDVREGQSGDAVILVRSLLRSHGYTCNSSGSYDSDLAEVVKQFQVVNGLEVDGIVDQKTLAVLEDMTADTAWLDGSTVKLTAGKLARAGFSGILIKPEIVTDINKSLNKYAITTGEKVIHFLAQIKAETSSSKNIMENYYRPGEGYVPPADKPMVYYSPYCGAGVLQLSTWDNYVGFSKYINDSRNGFPADDQIFQGDTEKENSADKAKNMYATQHVALKYPVISAGWYWDKARNFNSTTVVSWGNAETNPKSISDILTQKITGSSGTDLAVHQKIRFENYQEIKQILPYKK